MKVVVKTLVDGSYCADYYYDGGTWFGCVYECDGIYFAREYGSRCREVKKFVNKEAAHKFVRGLHWG